MIYNYVFFKQDLRKIKYVRKLCIQKSLKWWQRLVPVKSFSIFLTRYFKERFWSFKYIPIIPIIHVCKRVRLNYATTYHHPPTPTTTHHQPKYIHHHPPPSTPNQNISTTTHPQPKYIHRHPPPPITSQSISTTHRQPKFFYKKPMYKNLKPLA